MKRIQHIILLAIFLLVMFTIVPSGVAQEPPHPPSSGHGLKGDQNPGGASAPVGGGLSVLLALGAMYSGKKVFDTKEEK